MASEDAQMKLEQQQHLIEQLRALVRDRDEALQNKGKEYLGMNEERVSQSQDDGDENKTKALLFQKKLDEKDEVIKVREAQLEAKEKILSERDGFLQDLTQQLEEKTKAMESMQQIGERSGGDQGKIQEMVAQMVYKDKKVMEMNTKILEQDKRIMDLQEFAGEKDLVIRGRDKVVEILQKSIKEKDQAFQHQALLIGKLTTHVESTNERLDEVSEQLRQKENELKSETNRCHVKLTESQNYFEEMLHDMEIETRRLKSSVDLKDKELMTRENELRELILKHERDIETIMMKENIDLQDHVVQLLEGKLKDTNEVLDGKVKAIVALQKDYADKEKDLEENQESMKLIREKLQITTEQLMLMQSNFVDKESQWLEERQILQGKLKDNVDKYEMELSEKDLQMETLRTTLGHYEAAYAQASVQYNKLQEYYKQVLAGEVDIGLEPSKTMGKSGQNPEMESLRNELKESKDMIEKLSAQVTRLESAQSEESSTSANKVMKGDAKILKMKAQMTSRIKALEKELKELREKHQSHDVKALLEEKENLTLKVANFEENLQAIGTMNLQIENLHTCVDDLMEEKTRAQEDFNKMLKEKLTMEERLSDLSTNQQWTELNQELTYYKEREEGITQQMNEAVSNVEKLEAIKANLEDEVAKLKSEKCAFEMRKNNNLDDAEKENEELKEKVNMMADLLSANQADINIKNEYLAFMENKVKELESNLDDAIDDIKCKTENILHLQTEKDLLDGKLNDNVKMTEILQHDLENINVVKHEADKEVNRLTYELQNVQFQLGESFEQIKSLKAAQGKEIDKLHDDNDTLNKEILEKSKSLQSALNKLTTSNEEVLTLKNLLEKNNEQSSEQELQMKKLMIELNASREDERKKEKEFERKVGTLHSQIANLEAEVSFLQKDICNKETLIVEAKSSLSENEKKIKSLCNELSLSKAKCETIQCELCGTVEKLYSIEENLDSERKLNVELNTSIISHEENITQLKQCLEKKDEKIQLLEEKNSFLGAVSCDLIEVQSELETSKSRLIELDSVLECKQSEIEVLNHKCRDLQEQVNSILSELEISTSEVTDFKKVNDSLKIEVEEYRCQLTSMSGSLEDSEQMQLVITQLQQEKKAQKQLVTSLETQLVSLEAELKASHSICEKKDTQITILENDLKEENQCSISMHSTLLSMKKTQAQADQKIALLQRLEQTAENAGHTQTSETEEGVCKTESTTLSQVTHSLRTKESKRQEREQASDNAKNEDINSEHKEDSLNVNMKIEQGEQELLKNMEYRSFNENIRALEQDKTDLSTRIRDLEEIIAKERESCMDHCKNSEDIANELEDMKMQVHESRKLIEELKVLYCEKEKEIDVLCQKLVNSEIMLVEKSEEVKNLMEDLQKFSELKEAKAEMDNDMESVQSRGVQLENEVSLLSSKVNEAEERCTAALIHINMITEDKEAISHELKVLYEQICSEKKDINTSEVEKVRDLKATLIANSLELEEMGNTLSLKHKELEDANSSNERMKNEIQGLFEAVEEREKKISTLLADMNEMEERLMHSEKVRQDQEKEMSTAVDASLGIESITQALNKKQEELLEKELVAKKAIATAKKLKFNLNQANMSLEETKQQMEEIKRTKEDLETKLISFEKCSTLNQSAVLATSKQQLRVLKGVDDSDVEVTIHEGSVKENIQMVETAANSSLDLSTSPHSYDTSLELESLQSQLTTYKECCEELQKQLHNQTESLFEMESKLKSKQTEIQQLEGVKESLKLNITQMDVSLQNLQESHDTLQANSILERENLEMKYNIVEEQWKTIVDSLRQENSIKNERIQHLTEEIDKLKQETRDIILLKTNLEEKDEKVIYLMCQLEAEQSMLKLTESKRSDLEHQLKNDEEMVESLKYNETQLHNSLLKFKDLLEEKDNEIETINNDLKELKADGILLDQNSQANIQELSHLLQNSRVKVDELTASLEQSQNERNKEIAKSEHLRQEVASQGLLILNMNDTIAKIQKEYEDIKSSSLHEEHKYQNMVEDLNLELSCLRAKQEEKMKYDEDVDKAVDELKVVLQRTLEEKNYLEAEKEQLQHVANKQLEAAKGIISEKSDEVENVQVAFEKLQNVVSTLNGEKEVLLTSLESSRGELEGMEQVLSQLRLQEAKARDNVTKLTVEKDNLIANLKSNHFELISMQEELTALKSVNYEADPPPVKCTKEIMEGTTVEAFERFQQSSTPVLDSNFHTLNPCVDPVLTSQVAVKELNHVKTQLEDTRGKLQVAEVKCEKMLIKLKTFKDKNDRLQTQVDELLQAGALKAGGSPQRDSTLREERRRLEEQVTSLHNKLRDVEVHNGKLFHENSTLKSQMKEFEQLKSEANFESVSQYLKSKENECTELRSVIKSQKIELEFLEIELKKISMMQNDKTNEYKESTDLKDDLTELKEDIAILKEKLEAERHLKLEERTRMSEEINHGKVELENVIHQLDSLREELKTTQGKSEEESRRADIALSEVHRTKECLQKELRLRETEMNSEITSLQSRLNTLTEQYDALSIDNMKFQDLVASLNKSNSFLNRELDILRLNTKSIENDKQKMNDAQDLKILNSKLKDIEQERDSLQEELEELREELVSLRREKISFTEQFNGLSSSVEQLKSELTFVLEVKRDLEKEVNSLHWKLEETTTFKQEMDDLQSELLSATLEKKILSHDLEEARGELAALQTDKHLLMNEVERQGEMLEASRSTANVGTEKSEGFTPKGEIMKDEESMEQILAVQKVIDKQNDKIRLFEMNVSGLEKDLKEKDDKLLQVNELESSMSILQENQSILQIENKTLRKKLDNFNLKIDTVRSLETDFESLNIDFTKVLEEKSEMAYQIEQLHARIQSLMSKDYEVTFSVQHQEHVLREKKMLQHRVEELEETKRTSMEENVSLREELQKVITSLQEAEFEKNSLLSQLQLIQTEGYSSSKFHEEHIKLQTHFAQIMDEKNNVALELNQALHSLKQSQHRCQQTAAQVSQLAEDRSYLNTQLSTISKSLREKEQEWLGIRQQHGDLYQEYIASQAKVAELERRIALALMGKEVEETAAEADQVHAHKEETISSLSELLHQNKILEGNHYTLQTALITEREAKEKLEKDLNELQLQLLASGAGAREMHVHLENEEDLRIPETSALLSRQGMGYLSRIHSWLRTKKEYFSFSSRQLNRAMRLRPELRTIIWIYFIFLHLLLITCFGKFF